MLVEDDNSLREIYQARLLAEGYDIVTAKDGEEALALVGQEKPDLIILDVMMPKISGFDTLDIIRSTPATKEIKVVMMTALSQAEDKARAEKLGANKYLVKSQVTLEDIVKTVKEILGTQTPTAGAATGTPADPPASSQAAVPPTADPQIAPPADPTVTPTDSTAMANQSDSTAPLDASTTVTNSSAQPSVEQQATQPVTVMSTASTSETPQISQASNSLNSDGLPNISIDANGQVISGATSTDNATQNTVATPISTVPFSTTPPATITTISSEPQTTTQVTVDTSTAPTNSAAGEGGTRVIQPINDPNTDNAKLHQLLQEEQLRENQGKSNAGQVIPPSESNSMGESSTPSTL